LPSTELTPEVIPIARAEFINCPPPLRGSPRFTRGTEERACSIPPAGRGNLKEGASFVRVFAKFGVAISISHSRLVEVLKRPEDIL